MPTDETAHQVTPTVGHRYATWSRTRLLPCAHGGRRASTAPATSAWRTVAATRATLALSHLPPRHASKNNDSEQHPGHGPEVLLRVSDDETRVDASRRNERGHSYVRRHEELRENTAHRHRHQNRTAREQHRDVRNCCMDRAEEAADRNLLMTAEVDVPVLSRHRSRWRRPSTYRVQVLAIRRLQSLYCQIRVNGARDTDLNRNGHALFEVRVDGLVAVACSRLRGQGGDDARRVVTWRRIARHSQRDGDDDGGRAGTVTVGAWQESRE